ncbi:MAG: hypothetical protein KBF88_04515 [Polyangiaceae bacterium]|nr:hypothetical protein [Polyangiaceae bacterium]
MNRTKDTQAWIFQVWTAFALATVTTLVGICYLPLDIWHRAFLGLGFFFTVASSFTLAKTIRDNQEFSKGHAVGTAGPDPYRS